MWSCILVFELVISSVRRCIARTCSSSVWKTSSSIAKCDEHYLRLVGVLRRPETEESESACRARADRTRTGRGGLLRFLRIDTLNVDDLVRAPSDDPEHALPANGLAHEGRSVGEVVREVAVRELDHDRSCVQGRHPSALQIPDSHRRKQATSHPSNPYLQKPSRAKACFSLLRIGHKRSARPFSALPYPSVWKRP